MPTPSTRPAADAESDCIVRSVASALASDPTLEAVTIDRERQKIDVATLGKVDEQEVADRITRSVQQAQAATPETGCTLLTRNPDCTACKQPLTPTERDSVVITHQGTTTTIARVTCPTAPRFWRWRSIPWPRIVQRDIEFLEHVEEDADEWKPQLAAACLCGAFGLAGHFIPGYSLPLFIASYVAGSWYTAQEVWERLTKSAIDVHFLMLAVAAGSASIGFWAEGSTLLFLFSLSGALEHFALGRTQREIRSLFREAPRTAIVIEPGGVERETPVDTLAAGMRLLIKPGSQFPVDAEVIKGATAADESNLTGEAVPVDKGKGDRVLAGTINLWGAVDVEVLRPAKESSLQKIIHLIREAQHNKAPAQEFTDRFGTTYTYTILILSVVMFFVWWLGFRLPAFASNSEIHSAFYRAMTLLVVASPCALVLSIPSAVLAAIAWAARHGILFRGGIAVEKLARVNVVAMDKTGTLTTGELKVDRIESFPSGREKEIAQFACSLEQYSTHPLARAITRHGKQTGVETVELTNFQSITGQGLQASHSARADICRLGRREWLVKNHSHVAELPAPHNEPGVSEVWVAANGLVGRITLRDDIRRQARPVVDELKQSGLKTVVLTGDRPSTGEYLKNQLHIDDVRTELTPEQKVDAIRSLSAPGIHVAMIGDGVNDAPSLAAAYVGVAMGARGSDAALEQADIVLMHDRLENFLGAYRLSQRARRIIRQNLVISLGTVLVLVSFAFAGVIPLTIGVIGHEGSTVVVVMNSLRLLFGRSQKSEQHTST